jgi:hypothetical protein
MGNIFTVGAGLTLSQAINDANANPGSTIEFDLSGTDNETDMLMRNSNTGAFEVYDIVNNAITLATGMGQVGLEWQVAGVWRFLRQRQRDRHADAQRQYRRV